VATAAVIAVDAVVIVVADRGGYRGGDDRGGRGGYDRGGDRGPDRPSEPDRAPETVPAEGPQG